MSENTDQKKWKIWLSAIARIREVQILGLIFAGISVFIAVIGLIMAGIGLSNSFHWIGPDRGYGRCNLKPATPADIEAEKTHFENGLKHLDRGSKNASQTEYRFAEREFKAVLKKDPYFLGANLDLSYVYLARRKLDDAETALEKELSSIECLNTISEGDLSKFFYMLKQQPGQREIPYRERLKFSEDAVHYNLACLRLRQGDVEDAKSELKASAKNCSISQETFEHDHDLDKIRKSESEFRKLTECPSANR